MRWFVLLMLLALAACATETEPAAEALPAGEPAFDSPRDLIAAMRDRYDGQWYETLTFVQETIQYDQDGSADTSTWYEAYTAPGKLRIDFGAPEDGNGVLFADDMRYTVRNGEVTDTRPQVHPLLLLGFDVYHLPAGETASKLEALGFDLSKMHQATWQHRPAYVVGADHAEAEVSTFWVDQEHLYFTRMVRYVGPDTSNVQDVLFNQYERLGRGWIAPEVLFDFDGQPVMKETYGEMQTGMALDTTLFNPDHWRATHWR